jgi:hypothetical protein
MFLQRALTHAIRFSDQDAIGPLRQKMGPIPAWVPFSTRLKEQRPGVTTTDRIAVCLWLVDDAYKASPPAETCPGGLPASRIAFFRVAERPMIADRRGQLPDSRLPIPIYCALAEGRWVDTP